MNTVDLVSAHERQNKFPEKNHYGWRRGRSPCRKCLLQRVRIANLIMALKKFPKLFFFRAIPVPTAAAALTRTGTTYSGRDMLILSQAKRDYEFFNRGISGNKVSDMAAR
jgi:hypothetical protein